jgi:hypothetical protein
MELRFETDISGVLDLVHDRWFDLAQVKFDDHKQEVTFSLGEKRKGPFTDRILKISGVSNITIKDEAKIGIYDLCDLMPDCLSSSIKITSGFPLEIILEVKQQVSIYVLKSER